MSENPPEGVDKAVPDVLSRIVEPEHRREDDDAGNPPDGAGDGVVP